MTRLFALSVCLAAMAACARAEPATGTTEESTPKSEAMAGSSSKTESRWLGVGAGSLPSDYQVSIAQDLALADEVLPGPGTILFGPGKGAQVSRLQSSVGPDRVLAGLGDLLAPRGGRETTFVGAELNIDGAATPARVLKELRELLSRAGEPFVVYVAGHGEEGKIALWPQEVLELSKLVSHLERKPLRRRAIFVVTTCFGGSFAELAFSGPGKDKRATTADRCGLFATTGDLPADGCDPNPNRRAQEGYGIHFINALRSRDRDGRSLLQQVIDVDGDGRVSLLEAHARARIASKSANVPTTTSEHYLRSVAPASGPSASVDLPEERAVVTALVARLGLNRKATPRLSSLRERVASELAVIEGKHRLASALAEKDKRVEYQSYRRATGELLAKWPVLDDPWHPDYAGVLSEHRAAIASHLETSRSHEAYRAAVAKVVASEDEVWALRTSAAPWENLLRAIDTQILAGRLKARGGPDWARYQTFLRCERSIPERR